MLPGAEGAPGKGSVNSVFPRNVLSRPCWKDNAIVLSVMGLWVSPGIVILNLISLCSISNELFLKSAQGWWMAS